MNRVKAALTTTVIMALLAALSYIMWDFALRAFWVLALILAAWGFVSMTYAVYKLLAWAGPERAATPPWELPMEEADAAAWEAMGEKEGR